jgi:hypothetical protein
MRSVFTDKGAMKADSSARGRVRFSIAEHRLAEQIRLALHVPDGRSCPAASTQIRFRSGPDEEDAAHPSFTTSRFGRNAFGSGLRSWTMASRRLPRLAGHRLFKLEAVAGALERAKGSARLSNALSSIVRARGPRMLSARIPS